MKTTEIIALLLGIAIFIYLVAFKAYRMHKHPTWKSLIKEIKIGIGERLMHWAFAVMPDGPQKLRFAKFIIQYVNDEWDADTLAFKTFASSIYNNVPEIASELKKAAKDGAMTTRFLPSAVHVMTDNIGAFMTENRYLDKKAIRFIESEKDVRGLRGGIIIVATYHDSRAFSQMEDDVMKYAMAHEISVIDVRK